jgi:hypothetical protein
MKMTEDEVKQVALFLRLITDEELVRLAHRVDVNVNNPMALLMAAEALERGLARLPAKQIKVIDYGPKR